MTRDDDLDRIRRALAAAREALCGFTSGDVDVTWKDGARRDNPLTEADLAVNRVLRDRLPRPGEGWLSEETADDRDRLARSRVWIVDPIDGTKEFVAGIPEWCVSVGLVEDGRAVAGGILNPATGETVLGSLETGVTLDGARVRVTAAATLDGALVLGSRSEAKRGEWDRFDGSPFRVRNVGSVAYKLALVAAGKADATWTLVPKHEWDVAAGVALVHAAGGVVTDPQGGEIRFNTARPTLRGLAAAGRALMPAVLAAIA